MPPTRRSDCATAYETAPDARTPRGIPVRTNGHSIDLSEIDDEAQALMNCTGRAFDPTRFTVVLAPDTYMTVNYHQVFWCWAPEAGSDGYGPKEAQSCRGAIQWPNAVIVTPDLHSLRHELLHIAYRYDESDVYAHRRCTPQD